MYVKTISNFMICLVHRADNNIGLRSGNAEVPDV